jgi:hypothetical protein
MERRLRALEVVRRTGAEALVARCYEHGEGVRVEQVVLVTADGCEILSGHGLELLPRTDDLSEGERKEHR